MAATEELFLRQKEHAVKLPSFEGPLDLLLFLIRRNEIDIYDIPIEKVLIQYLDALHSMDDLKPEVAGEFFVMAATLMQIKSRLLLPKERRPIEAVEDGAEEEMIDPRWELVQQLLTYRKFKDAALELDELIEAASHALPRLVAEDPSLKRPRPLKSSDRLEIWNAFNAVLRRLSERISVGEIDDEIITGCRVHGIDFEAFKYRGALHFHPTLRRRSATKSVSPHLKLPRDSRAHSPQPPPHRAE